MNGKDIIVFECELTVYRKGSLLVRLNLEQGMMVWKDSRQWCNNFVRTLTDDQVIEFRDLISQILTLAGRMPEVPPEADTPAGHDEILLLSVCDVSARIDLVRQQIDTSVWTKLRRAIERLSRIPFRL